MRRFIITLLALALISAACATESTGGDDGPTVVVTTTVLGDIVGEVVGEAGSIEVLMPIGADPHDFSASSAQVAAVNKADLVVANGLGLEEGLEDVLEAAVDDGVTVLWVAELVDPLPYSDSHEDEDHEEDHEGDHEGNDEGDHEEGDHVEGDEHDHGDLDPHVWMDPLRMVDAAAAVAAALEVIEAGGPWGENAAEYGVELEELHAEIDGVLEVVEVDQRKLVTNHEALGYFADRYGFELVGVVIPGGSTLGEPSSAALAALVATMESEGVDVVFAETTEPSALAEALVDELGEDARVVELFTGSLGGDGSGAETYIDMLRTNAELVADALG